MKSQAITHKNIFYPPGGILIWIIIFLELITFGIALIAMVFSSKDNPELFHDSRLQLDVLIGTLNTLFLITSGFFMAKSVLELKNNNNKKSVLFLNLTIIGGFLFLILKSIEYYIKIESGLTINHNIFFTYYWLLSLFHVVHVIVGLVILFVVGRSLKKNNTNIEDFEASAAFWHMCDLIWLLLFPIIYLIF